MRRLLPWVCFRVVQRVLLAVVFVLLLDSAVAVFAWVLLPLWGGHLAPFVSTSSDDGWGIGVWLVWWNWVRRRQGIRPGYRRLR